jgi:hypothetical protein
VPKQEWIEGPHNSPCDLGLIAEGSNLGDGSDWMGLAVVDHGHNSSPCIVGVATDGGRLETCCVWFGRNNESREKKLEGMILGNSRASQQG